MTILTATDSELVHLPYCEIEDIASTRPALWRHIGMLAAEDLILAVGAMRDLMIRNAEQRLVAKLLRVAGCRHHVRDSQTMDMEQRINASHEEIAVAENLSRSSMSQILSRLEAAGLIKRNYRQLLLLDPAGLRARLLAVPRH